MKYKVYGPYEIPMLYGKDKKWINKEDIGIFWGSVGSELRNGCGVYVFSIKTKNGEKPWYVGKARNQSFSQECFTPDKTKHYHKSLQKSNGTPTMYFLARVTNTDRMSKPSSSAAGHTEIDFVEKMFIEMGYHKNKNIRNKKGTKNSENLVIEGFYNHEDRRKKSVKQLYNLFVDHSKDIALVQANKTIVKDLLQDIDDLNIQIDYYKTILDDNLDEFISSITTNMIGKDIVLNAREIQEIIHLYDENWFTKLPYSFEGKVQIASALAREFRDNLKSKPEIKVPVLWEKIANSDMDIIGRISPKRIDEEE